MEDAFALGVEKDPLRARVVIGLAQVQSSILLRAPDNITRIVRIDDRKAVQLPAVHDYHFVELDAPEPTPNSHQRANAQG